MSGLKKNKTGTEALHLSTCHGSIFSKLIPSRCGRNGVFRIPSHNGQKLKLLGIAVPIHLEDARLGKPFMRKEKAYGSSFGISS